MTLNEKEEALLEFLNTECDHLECANCPLDKLREGTYKNCNELCANDPLRAYAALEEYRKTKRANALFEEQVSRCRSVLCSKGEEYATEDEFHNFRVAASMLGMPMIIALAGMMAKHTVSLYDMCCSGKKYPLALWEEKITDHLNYLFLLNDMVRTEKTGVLQKNEIK